MNKFQDVKLKDSFVEKCPILKDRISNYRRPWRDARIRKNILGFNFHLYRNPASYRINGKLKDLWKNGPNLKPPFGKGLTYDKWEYRIKKLCPLQYDFREWLVDVEYRLRMIPRNIRSWYIKNILDRIKPYNVVKVQSLPRTYCDKYTLLEHSMFQVLEDFMKLDPASIHDYECDEHWKKWWVEVQFLHSWWNNRETWEQEWETKLDVAYAREDLDLEELKRLEEEKNAEFEDKLIRLIKIRQGLWT